MKVACALSYTLDSVNYYNEVIVASGKPQGLVKDANTHMRAMVTAHAAGDRKLVERSVIELSALQGGGHLYITSNTLRSKVSAHKMPLKDAEVMFTELLVATETGLQSTGAKIAQSARLPATGTE